LVSAREFAANSTASGKDNGWLIDGRQFICASMVKARTFSVDLHSVMALAALSGGDMAVMHLCCATVRSNSQFLQRKTPRAAATQHTSNCVYGASRLQGSFNSR
jgi:hypothetical protein